jgi:ligand-binding sensor domain-containing protein/DNA-binding CsgD family transcriptional regulator
MKRIALNLFLLSLVFFAAGESPVGTGFQLERITMADGLSSNLVFCMLQDRTGFLWVGTDNGLNRYDGREFKVFRHRSGDSASLAHNSVTALCQDSAGAIWVGTWGGGLDRLDPQTETFTHFSSQPGSANSLSHNIIRDLFINPVDPDWLWIATWGGGLNRLHLKTKRFECFRAAKGKPDLLRSDYVQFVFADRTGSIWVGTPMGLQRFIPRTRTFDYYPVGLVDEKGFGEQVRSIYESPDRPGVLWVGFLGRGLHRFEPASRSWQKQRPLTYGGKKTPIWNVFCIRPFPGRPGDLLLGMGRGLFCFEPGSQTYTPIPALGADEKIAARDIAWTILQDAGGILWASSFGSGMQKLDPYLKPVRHTVIAGRVAGAIRTIQSLAEDGQGRILIADRGSDLLANGGPLAVFQRDSGVMNPLWPDPGKLAFDPSAISSVTVTPSGDVWLGATWAAVWLNSGAEQPRVFKLAAPATDPETGLLGAVLCISEDTVGRVWCGTATGVSLLDPASGKGRFFPLESGEQVGLRGHYIQDILASRDGRVWVATEDGLFRYAEPERRFERIRDRVAGDGRLDDEHVNDLYQDERGRIWVATQVGINLVEMHGDRVSFRHFAPRGFSSPAIAVHSLLTDGAGDVWAGTARGIARLQPGSGTFDFYGASDGGGQVEFLDGVCLRTRDKEFFFGGKKGLISFRPDQWKFASHAPPIVLTDFLVGNKALAEVGIVRPSPAGSPRASVSLPFHMNNISLQFAALDFHQPKENQFAFTLADPAKGWTYLGYDRRIHLPGLEPGKYALRVIGANSDGWWNKKGFLLEIRIRPPFWRTWWFKGIGALALIGLLAAWLARRKRKWAEKIKSQLELEHFCRRFGVSKREMEIIGMLLRGKSNKTIEDELFIASSTVRNHVYNIYQKLGIKSRLQLITLFKNFH